MNHSRRVLGNRHKRSEMGGLPDNITGEKYTDEVGYSAGKAKSLSTVTGFIVGTNSIKLLSMNLSRVYLLIQNKSAGSIFVNFSAIADEYNSIKIEAGGFYEPYRAPLDSVYILGSAASLQGAVIESIGRGAY